MSQLFDVFLGETVFRLLPFLSGMVFSFLTLFLWLPRIRVEWL